MNSKLLILLILAQISAFGVFYKTKYRMWKNETVRYRLFRVRDELIELAASGKLQQQEFLFQYFYTANNLLIKHAKHLTLTAWLRAINTEMGAAQKELVEAIELELAFKDADVSLAVQHFYEAIAEITIANSVTLSLLGRFHWLRRIVKSLYRFGCYYRDYDKRWRAYADYTEAAIAVQNPRAGKQSKKEAVLV